MPVLAVNALLACAWAKLALPRGRQRAETTSTAGTGAVAKPAFRLPTFEARLPLSAEGSDEAHRHFGEGTAHNGYVQR
jgi:hypothetical protein